MHRHIAPRIATVLSATILACCVRAPADTSATSSTASTRTNATEQQRVMNEIIGFYSMFQGHDCTQNVFVSAKAIPLRKASEDAINQAIAGNPDWKELWTVDHCGSRADYDI